MQLDRRVMLTGLASNAAVLCLPSRARASVEAEYFAAARAIYSAALFNLKSGDLRAVELPGRGHDITLKPDGSESFNQDEIALFIVDGHAAGA